LIQKKNPKGRNGFLRQLLGRRVVGNRYCLCEKIQAKSPDEFMVIDSCIRWRYIRVIPEIIQQDSSIVSAKSDSERSLQD
jgi:hypothetical protein